MSIIVGIFVQGVGIVIVASITVLAQIPPLSINQKPLSVYIGATELNGIVQVAMGADGHITITHNDGIIRVLANDIPKTFLERWGVKLPEVPQSRIVGLKSGEKEVVDKAEPRLVRPSENLSREAPSGITRFDGKISTVFVNGTIGDFFITASNSAALSVKDETNHMEVEYAVRQSGDEVHISVKNRKIVTMNPGRVTIRLPAGCAFEAKSMSSSFDIAGFSGSKLHIETMSGNIRATTFGTSSTQLNSISGAVRATGIAVDGAHRFASVSGDVVVRLEPGSSAKVTAHSERVLSRIQQRQEMARRLESVVGGGVSTVALTSVSGNAEVAF